MSEGLRIAACSVMSLARLPEAEILSASFESQHPSAQMFLVPIDHQRLVESVLAGRDGPGQVVSLGTLGIDDEHSKGAVFEWDEVGAVRAMTPRIAQALLAQHDDIDVLLVLAPWTEVHAPLDGIAAGAADLGWAHVPKRLGPVRSNRGGEGPLGLSTDAAPEPRIEADLLLDGVSSWDVLAFSRGSGETLDWLADRMRQMPAHPATERYALSDGRELDRLIDVAAAVFPTYACRDQGMNVGAWNLDERILSRDPLDVVRCDVDVLRLTNHLGLDVD